MYIICRPYLTPMEALIKIVAILLLVGIGILLKIGWEWFYSKFIYHHTKKYKEECKRVNEQRAAWGWGPKYDEKGRLIDYSKKKE